jgi:hypothetical protein
MEGNRTTAARTLTRRFESNRLEERLWSLAYEHIWPVVRRSWKRSVQERVCQSGSDAKPEVARRA